MLFQKRSFSQECLVRLSPVIDLIHETLENKIKAVDSFADACELLKRDTLVTQAQSLGDGKVFDMALLIPRRENLQRYRQLRVQIELHRKTMSDVRNTTYRMLVFLGYKDTLTSLNNLAEKSSVPPYAVHHTVQPLMTGINNLVAQLEADKRQLEALQQMLIQECRQKKHIEKLRAMLS